MFENLSFLKNFKTNGFVSAVGFFLVISSVLLPSWTVKLEAQEQANLESGEHLFISEINFRGSVDELNRCIADNFVGTYETNVTFCWKDEWMEIFNPTSKPVDLTNWKLNLRNGKFVLLTGTISPGGYYTIGHTHQNGSFKSMIPSFNVASHNLIHISSDAADNVFYELVTESGQTVDKLNSTHSAIEQGVNSKGKSFFRCGKEATWQISTAKINEANFGTPNTGNCKITVVDPVIDEVTPISETLPETQPKPAPATEIIPETQKQDSVVSSPKAVVKPVTNPVVSFNPQVQTKSAIQGVSTVVRQNKVFSSQQKSAITTISDFNLSAKFEFNNLNQVERVSVAVKNKELNSQSSNLQFTPKVVNLSPYLRSQLSYLYYSFLYIQLGILTSLLIATIKFVSKLKNKLQLKTI